MAKAKKQSSEAKSEKTPAPAAAKKAAKKAPAKSGGQPAGMPLIDTSLAAQSAARMVASRERNQTQRSGESQQESSAFRQMKESVNKPGAQGPASFLQNTAPIKKSSQPFGGPNQVGKNQTFGADVNRTGVPRRTGG
jgi:hypothetical protein